MIVDCNTLEPGTTLLADICVVGASEAGLLLAREFAGSPHRVVVLEDDAFTPSSEHTTPEQLEPLLRLDALDTEERSWVPGSGWPLTLADLADYYARAESATLYRPPDTSPTTASPYDRTKLAMRRAPLRSTSGERAPSSSDFEAIREVQVIRNARVTEIETDAHSARAQHVQVRSEAGATCRVQAQHFVLSGDAVQVARLLLASDTAHPGGLGNRHGLVGRYLQRPAHLPVPITSNGASSHEPPMASTADEPRSASVLVSAADWRREYEQLNVAAVAHPSTPGTALSNDDSRGVMRSPSELLAAVLRFATPDSSSSPSEPQRFHLWSEVVPVRESRVTLGRERDAHGRRRAVLSERLDGRVGDTLEAFARVINAELNRLHFGRLELSAFPLPNDPTALQAQIHGSSTPRGTTRMHDDPRHGVVDTRCRLHDVPNLYVASSSVFPTSSFVNPALTVCALALRIADTLRTQLRASS